MVAPSTLRGQTLSEAQLLEAVKKYIDDNGEELLKLLIMEAESYTLDRSMGDLRGSPATNELEEMLKRYYCALWWTWIPQFFSRRAKAQHEVKKRLNRLQQDCKKNPALFAELLKTERTEPYKTGDALSEEQFKQTFLLLLAAKRYNIELVKQFGLDWLKRNMEAQIVRHFDAVGNPEAITVPKNPCEVFCMQPPTMKPRSHSIVSALCKGWGHGFGKIDEENPPELVEILRQVIPYDFKPSWGFNGLYNPDRHASTFHLMRNIHAAMHVVSKGIWNALGISFASGSYSPTADDSTRRTSVKNSISAAAKNGKCVALLTLTLDLVSGYKSAENKEEYFTTSAGNQLLGLVSVWSYAKTKGAIARVYIYDEQTGWYAVANPDVVLMLEQIDPVIPERF